MQSRAACSSAASDVATFSSSAAAAVVAAAAAGLTQESADTAGDGTVLYDGAAFAAREGHVSGNKSDTAAVAVEAVKQQEQQQQEEEEQEQRESSWQQQEPSMHAAASYRPLDTPRRYQAFLQAEAAGGVPGLSPAAAAALRQQIAQLTAAAVQHPQQPQLQPCASKSSSVLQQLQQVRDSLANSTLRALPGCGCGPADTAAYPTCVAHQELAGCNLTSSCLRQNVSRVAAQVRTLNRMLLSHSQQLAGHGSLLHGNGDAADTVQGLPEVPAARDCVEGGGPARHQLDQGCSSNVAAAAGGLQRDCYTTLEHTLMEIRQHRAKLC